MKTTAIVCIPCRRVVAVGARLPATCLAAVPEADRRRLPGSELDAHPAVHTWCVELEILTAADVEGEALLEEVNRAQAEAIAALAHLKIDGDHPLPAGST